MRFYRARFALGRYAWESWYDAESEQTQMRGAGMPRVGHARELPLRGSRGTNQRVSNRPGWSEGHIPLGEAKTPRRPHH